jgi:predicted dehydrogenase
MKNLNIAIVGCGNIGKKRLKAILNDKYTKIKFIVGPKKFDNSLKKLANSIQATYLNDWQDILNKNLDAAILSTPPEFFFDIGKNILKSSINLLIEKPLGLNVKEAKFLTNLAKKKRLVLKTGFNLRFDDGVKAVKKILDNKINDIYFIKISYVNGTVKTNKNNLGSLLDIGSHSVNLLNFLTNNKKLEVLNSSLQMNEYHKNDNGFIVIKIGKILSHIHHSFVRWENKFSLEIFYKQGSIELYNLPKWGQQVLIKSTRQYPSGFPKKYIKYFRSNKDNSWFNEWLHFKKLILNKDFSNNNEGLINMSFLNNCLTKSNYI